MAIGLTRRPPGARKMTISHRRPMVQQGCRLRRGWWGLEGNIWGIHRGMILQARNQRGNWELGKTRPSSLSSSSLNIWGIHRGMILQARNQRGNWELGKTRLYTLLYRPPLWKPGGIQNRVASSLAPIDNRHVLLCACVHHVRLWLARSNELIKLNPLSQVNVVKRL
jgi:hypothetical protein